MKPARSHRLVVALVAVALHAGLIALLGRIPREADAARLASPPITWIALTARVGSNEAKGPPAPVFQPKPPAAPVIPAIVTARPEMAPNHSAEALQSYVLCSLPAQSLSPDQRARCAVLRQGMVREPLAMRKAPTEAETARDLRLAHDLAVQKTPPALPCVAGGINVMCVMGGLLHGFGGMGSYADVHPTKKRGESLMPPLH